MWKYTLPVLAALTLAACGQTGGQADGQEGGQKDEPASMPEMTFSVTEKDDKGELVMEATVKFKSDGAWKRKGTDPGSGSLTDKQVTKLDGLAKADDFPEGDKENGNCMGVMPPYAWNLKVGDESVSNGNNGCVSSESAVDITKIIQDATKVGPTLDSNKN